MDTMPIASALMELADIANCVHGDFHTMHLNYTGVEFDTMHKEVLQKYYEEAAEDYDTWAEAASMYGVLAPNKLNSADRIEWKPVNGQANRESAIEETKRLLETYTEQLVNLFGVLNKNDKCAISVGVSNTLQTRIEFWIKELAYFNVRRAA